MYSTDLEESQSGLDQPQVKSYREIIEETAAAYTSLTRAADGGRNHSSECYYIHPDTGNMCGIGRCCEAPSSDWVGKWTHLHLNARSPKLEPHERELLLKPEYRGKDPYFWMELQDLHDQPNNWTKSGLSQLGRQEVERLMERWGKRDA